MMRERPMHRWRKVPETWSGYCRDCGLLRRGRGRPAMKGNRRVWVDEYSADGGKTWREGKVPLPCPAEAEKDRRWHEQRRKAGLP